MSNSLAVVLLVLILILPSIIRAMGDAIAAVRFGLCDRKDEEDGGDTEKSDGHPDHPEHQA